MSTTINAKLHLTNPLASTCTDLLSSVEEDALAHEAFERTGPVSSQFWDTAIEPIPWPT